MKSVLVAIILLMVASHALATPRVEKDFRRAQWKATREAFNAWAARDALGAIPTEVDASLSPRDMRPLTREVAGDRSRQLALAILFLQKGRAAAAAAQLGQAARDPALAERAHALMGCALVVAGQYRRASRYLDAAADDAACRWAPEQDWEAPVAAWRAASHVGLADAPAARDVLELEGDRVGALAAWRTGGCEPRRAERTDDLDPLEILSALPTGWWAPSGLVGAVAAAAVGDVQGARRALEETARSCRYPSHWTPECIRLPRVEAELNPSLARLELAAASRTLPSPPSAFTVLPVPPNLRLKPDAELDGRSFARGGVPSALSGWLISRIEREGEHVVAISVGSTRFEQMDALPSYRLHLSRDGGAHFDEPVLLGFREFGPWRLRPRSRIPVQVGDALQIEVLRCPSSEVELAESNPFINVKPWPCQGRPLHAVLAFSLEALLRDTDADGLSDVQENWWFLDPARGDTDGDTLPDGEDPSPRTPPTSARPELAPFIEWLVSDGVRISADGPQTADAAASREQLQAPEALLQESLFLAQIVPIPLFHQKWMAGVDEPPPPPARGTRIIVLSQSEARARHAQVQGRGGVGLRILFNAEGSRVLLAVDRDGEGSTYTAERTSTGWILHAGMGWVS